MVRSSRDQEGKYAIFRKVSKRKTPVIKDGFDSRDDASAYMANNAVEIIGVDPKALSLNGELALAFGARGHGLSGASAHYERDYGVINLTKLQGAGALAHEWMHALDNYFARQDTKSSSEKEEGPRGGQVYKSGDPKRDFLSHGRSYKSQSRKELTDAWKKVMDTVPNKSKEYVEDFHQVNKWAESAQKTLDTHITAIRNDLAEERTYGKRLNAPASEEQLAELDRLLDKVRRGEGMEEKFLESKRRRHFPGTTTDTLNEISVIYKKVRGRTGLTQQDVLQRLRSAYNSYINAVARADQAKEQVSKTKTIRTDFAYEAVRMDMGQVQDYWTTKHEMMARAFEAYIEDRVKEEHETEWLKEIVAKVAERRVRHPLLIKIYAAIRRFLRTKFGIGLSFTGKELQALLIRANESMIKGRAGGASPSDGSLNFDSDSNPDETEVRRQASTFSQQNAKLREENKTLWDKATTELRRQFTPGGLLPTEVFKEKIARDSQFEVIEFDVRHLIGNFERAVKKDYKKAASNLSEKDTQTLSDALSGEMATDIRSYQDGDHRDEAAYRQSLCAIQRYPAGPGR